MPLKNFALGKCIKHYRKKRGLSQSHLSELIDKSPSYLSYIESGLRCISLDTLVDLANALNISTDLLLRDSLDNTPIIMRNDFAAALADCTDYEQKLLLEVLITVKATIRSNKKLFYACYPRR